MMGIMLIATVLLTLLSHPWLAAGENRQHAGEVIHGKVHVSDISANQDSSSFRHWHESTLKVFSAETEPAQTEGKSWLGIVMKLQTKPENAPVAHNAFPAIEVTKVIPGYGASIAGLKVGDLIIGIDGRPLEGINENLLSQFLAVVSRTPPGKLINLRILRGSIPLELGISVQSYPWTKPVLKLQPDLAGSSPRQSTSFLENVLERGRLMGEFQQLINGFRKETGKMDSPFFSHKNGYNPFRLQEVNYVMHHPLELPLVGRKISSSLHEAFQPKHYSLLGLIGIGMDELDIQPTPGKLMSSAPPTNVNEYVVRLVKAMEQANEERAIVLSVLDAGEIDFLYETAPNFLVGDWGLGGNKNSEIKQDMDESRLIKFFSLVLKLDLARLFNATAELAHAIDLPLLKTLDRSDGKLAHYPENWVVRAEDNLTTLNTPIGRVLIGGTKDNVYTEDAALIIDLGGNDKYFNHAGGTSRSHPFAVVIDLTGDDVYSSTDDFSQGAGLLGGGILVDLEGNDRYTAKKFSQGAGLLGIGILADLAGNDQYTAVSVSQGAAAFGIGVLAEGGGDDTYWGNFFVQGAGYIKGFGSIIETSGNDKYFAGGLYEDFREPGKAYLSLSQGFGYGMRPGTSLIGASGGIGVLADADGDDLYKADYFSQGASYWFSIGILDDYHGNDRYISGRYSQGAGVHMAAGVLIDSQGDDEYLASYGVAQGCGHDFGVGVLVDGGGNDRYVSKFVTQGGGSDNGIGLLIDSAGDDEYSLNSSGHGHGNFEPTRGLASFGFLFDMSGTNVYQPGSTNDGITYRPHWGIHVDGVRLP